MVRFYGSPPAEFSVPAGSVSVTVDTTTTLVTGGTLDWIGRPSIWRRSDDALVMVYYRATGHATNDGAVYIRYSDDDGATWTAENTKLAGDGGGAVTGFPLNPTVSAGEDAFEPLLMGLSTADEALLHTWRFNFGAGGSNGGTYQWRTTDGGVTWTSEGGPVAWAGLTPTQNGKTYATDQGVLVGSNLFVGGRVYNDPDEDPTSLIFSGTTDDGATWTRLATLVSAASLGGHGTQEIGFTRVGSRFLGIIRDVAAVTHTYAMVSDDLNGVSWGSLEDWTARLGIMGRPRLYTRAQLKGQANWWNDPVLILSGFEHQTPGTSTSRRNAVWISRDSGGTWDGPNYIDTTNDDGGYSDVFYDAGNDQYVVVSYRGTLTAADLKQYRLSIAGI
jgi:hypothetical protein